MPLTQTSNITVSRRTISGETIRPQLTISGDKVQLSLQTSSGAIATATETVGTTAANDLVSYVDTTTNQLTPTGESFALTLSLTQPDIDTPAATVANFFAQT